MTEQQALVCLSSFIPFGPVRINLLTNYFGSARKVWSVGKKQLLETGVGEKRVNEFDEYRKNFSIREYFAGLRQNKIAYTTLQDEDYPEKLKEIPDAPFVLYYKGVLNKDLKTFVAIVGSRKMTAYGREVTQTFSTQLSVFGVTIVSGLARGVDTAAHQACLDTGGITWAVIGCGLDKIYPPENWRLAKKIIELGGALISEFPLGYPALPINFAMRNRIISGLSTATLVVEGMEKSGTLLTASHAAEQGRQVFAVPGQITSPLSGAPHFLIKNGAKPAFAPSDILEELDIEEKRSKLPLTRVSQPNEEEKPILVLLENEALHIDEIARMLSLSISLISARLTVMELRGMVKNIGNGVYRIVR